MIRFLLFICVFAGLVAMLVAAEAIPGLIALFRHHTADVGMLLSRDVGALQGILLVAAAAVAYRLSGCLLR